MAQLSSWEVGSGREGGGERRRGGLEIRRKVKVKGSALITYCCL